MPDAPTPTPVPPTPTPAPPTAASPLFHIAFATEWEAAKVSGTYTSSTRGASLAQVGFIHLSFRHQVDRVRKFLYSDCPDALVLLELDPALMLGADVRLEDGGSGENFPHLYGPLSPAWVVAVLRACVHTCQFGHC